MINYDTWKTTPPCFDKDDNYSILRNDKLYVSCLRLDAIDALKNESDKYNCTLIETLEEKEKSMSEYINDYIEDHFERLEGAL